MCPPRASRSWGCVQGPLGEDRICEQEHKGLHRRACEQGRCGHGVRRRGHAGELRKARAENLVLVRWGHALGGIFGSRSVTDPVLYVFTLTLKYDCATQRTTISTRR